MGFMQPSEETTENEVLEDGAGSTDARVYEVGYHLVPTVAEEDIPALYTALKDAIIALGGETVADEMPRMINLAYPMVKVVYNVRSKFTSAYFGWVKFVMDSDKVLELKKKLDLDPNILRFLILKTVKENTIASKRFIGRDLHKKPTYTKKEGEEAQPINKEELDQEIDAMVAV
ncbi:MAG: 30S ribosomal protein S6, partial [Candidatus Paceibacterota bacterium]